jgi:UDP-N-acetylglucosamine:LPS N-acetylglucosamine transferase
MEEQCGCIKICNCSWKAGKYMAKKILIIYEKMGMGHFRMASILEDILKDEDVEIVKHAGSDLINDKSVTSLVQLWNILIRKDWITLADAFMNFFLRIFILPIFEVSSTKPLLREVEKENPDIIICTSDAFNKILGSYAKEKGIPFYIFITEISIFIDLVNPYATHLCYFSETGEAIRNYDFDNTYYSYKLNKDATWAEKLEYILMYYKDYIIKCYKNSVFRNPDRELAENNNAKFKVIGPIAEKKHFVEKDIEAIKNKYEINNGKDSVIIASGSIGGKFLLEMVKVICKEYKKPVNLLVICGKDERTFNELKKFEVSSSNISLMPFKYVDNFDELLSAADCVIGRPSAGIFIESLLNRTPEITFKKATSNDKGTLTMINKYSIGKVVEGKNDIVDAVDSILSDKAQYQNNIEKLLNLYCNTYEDKKELLKDIILNSTNYEYEVNEEFNTEMGLNSPVSH